MNGARHTYFHRMWTAWVSTDFTWVTGFFRLVFVKRVCGSKSRKRPFADCKFPFNFFDLNLLVASVMSSEDFYPHKLLNNTVNISFNKKKKKTITDLDLMTLLNFFQSFPSFFFTLFTFLPSTYRGCFSLWTQFRMIIMAIFFDTKHRAHKKF